MKLTSQQIEALTNKIYDEISADMLSQYNSDMAIIKKKFEKTGVVKELRSRQAFEKPCITKRMQRIRAAYKQQMQIADVEG
jgi:ribosomal protein S21